jgi:hypothetical protein
VTSRVASFQKGQAHDHDHDYESCTVALLLGNPGFQGPLRGEFIDGDRFFQLTAPLIYQSAKGWPLRNGTGSQRLFIIPEGRITDLETFPKVALPFTVSAKCGVLHDEAFKEGWLSWWNSNFLYYEALGFQNVAEWRRNARWAGVTVGSYGVWHRYRAAEKTKSFLANGGADI